MIPMIGLMVAAYGIPRLLIEMSRTLEESLSTLVRGATVVLALMGCAALGLLSAVLVLSGLQQ